MEALLVLLFTIFSLVFQPAEAYSFGVGDGLTKHNHDAHTHTLFKPALE